MVCVRLAGDTVRHMRSATHGAARAFTFWTVNGADASPSPSHTLYAYWPRIFISISIPLSLIVHLLVLNCSCLSGRYRYSIFSWWPAKRSIKAAAKALRQLLSSPCGFSRLSGQSFAEHGEQSSLVMSRHVCACCAGRAKAGGRLAVVGL